AAARRADPDARPRRRSGVRAAAAAARQWTLERGPADRAPRPGRRESGRRRAGNGGLASGALEFDRRPRRPPARLTPAPPSDRGPTRPSLALKSRATSDYTGWSTRIPMTAVRSPIRWLAVAALVTISAFAFTYRTLRQSDRAITSVEHTQQTLSAVVALEGATADLIFAS